MHPAFWTVGLLTLGLPISTPIMIPGRNHLRFSPLFSSSLFFLPEYSRLLVTSLPFVPPRSLFRQDGPVDLTAFASFSPSQLGTNFQHSGCLAGLKLSGSPLPTLVLVFFPPRTVSITVCQPLLPCSGMINPLCRHCAATFVTCSARFPWRENEALSSLTRPPALSSIFFV